MVARIRKTPSTVKMNCFYAVPYCHHCSLQYGRIVIYLQNGKLKCHNLHFQTIPWLGTFFRISLRFNFKVFTVTRSETTHDCIYESIRQSSRVYFSCELIRQHTVSLYGLDRTILYSRVTHILPPTPNANLL